MRIKTGNKERNILQAAIQVFAQQGYHNAKISKIAEVAGVGTVSVYLYFRTKEDILNKIFDDIWQRLARELKTIVNRADLNPTEKLDGMIDSFFDIFIEDPMLAIVYVNEQNHLIQNGNGDFTVYFDKFLDLGIQVLKEGVQKNIFNQNLDLKVLRFFVFGGLHHLMHQWAHDPNSFPLSNIRQGVKFIIKRGILNPDLSI